MAPRGLPGHHFRWHRVESGRHIYRLWSASHCFTNSFSYPHENGYLHPDCHQDEDSHVNAAADVDQISHHNSATYAGLHFNLDKISDADPNINTYRNDDTHPVTNADALNFITKGEK